MSKTIPFSARITSEDAEFINSLSYDGAYTASDKLRALLSEIRSEREQQQDYGHQLKRMQHWMLDIKRQLSQREQQLGKEYQSLSLMLDWLPELLAELQLMGNQAGKLSADDLARNEKNLWLRLEKLLRVLLASQLADHQPFRNSFNNLIQMLNQHLSTKENDHE